MKLRYLAFFTLFIATPAFAFTPLLTQSSDTLGTFRTNENTNWTNINTFLSAGGGFSTSSANYWSSVGLGFSTTSAAYWKTQNNFFSTTSANYWSSLGLGFSTTSADYWKTQRGFSSTTLLGDTNTWTGTNNFGAITVSSCSGCSAANFPFTPTTNFGALTNSTTTALWLKNGLQASSTLYVQDVDIAGYYGLKQDGQLILQASSTTGTISVGQGAGARSNVNATYNTLFGYNAGTGITTGAQNTILGSWPTASAMNLTSGTGNTLIGTGISLPSATANNQLNIGNILFGRNLDGSGLTYSSGQLGVGSTTANGTTRLAVHLNNGDTNKIAFAIGSSTSNSTTTLFAIDNTGSTTASNGITLSSGCFKYQGACLTQGAAATRTLTVSGTTNQVSVSGGTQDLSADRTWTVSLPNNVIFPISFNSSYGTTTFASSTALTATNLYATNATIGSATGLVITTSGAVSTISGTTCTNQFLRGFTSSGGSCATVANTDLANSSINLTYTGNVSGGASVALGSSLNITVPFSFTPTTSFATTANSTSTLLAALAGLTASSTIRFGIAGSPLAFTMDSNGRVGIGSSTPSQLQGISIGTSTVFSGTQLAVNIASSSTSAATYTVNWDNGNTARYILTQATNFIINATSSNPRDGGKYLLKICQDATGSRTATFITPGQLNWGSGTTSVLITPNTATWIGMIYDGRTQRYDVIGSTTVATTNSCQP